MISWFDTLGFSAQDKLLLVLCPLCAAIGGFTHAWLLKADYTSKPRPGGVASLEQLFGNLAWLAGRLLLSAVAGLVLALYFVGALTETPTTVARILAFAILVGYAAPRLWVAQEGIITKAIEEKLRSALKEQSRGETERSSDDNKKVG